MLHAFIVARFPQKIDEAWFLVLRRFNYLVIYSIIPFRMDETGQWRVTCQTVTVHRLDAVVITPRPSQKIRPVCANYSCLAVDIFAYKFNCSVAGEYLEWNI